MTDYWLSRRRSSVGIRAAVIAAMIGGAPMVAHADGPPLARVRSNTPSIAAVIQQAAERSTVFRRLIETIDATDGLVYVDEGKCGHSVRACLNLAVQVAGPYRLLRILVDPRKHSRDCELMASIAHELWHATEVLGEPNVRNYHAAYSFFERLRPTDTGKGRFETPAAVRTGLNVVAEACARPDAPRSRDHGTTSF